MREFKCQDCRSWGDCPFNSRQGILEGKEKLWYHYGEIRFCPHQVIWLIQNSEALRAGKWPAQYIDAERTRQLKPEAYFTKAKLVLIEVEVRLAKTPNNGEILITQVDDGRGLHNLSIGAREVLMYVKGSGRKNTGFKRWLREVYYA